MNLALISASLIYFRQVNLQYPLLNWNHLVCRSKSYGSIDFFTQLQSALSVHSLFLPDMTYNQIFCIKLDLWSEYSPQRRFSLNETDQRGVHFSQPIPNVTEPLLTGVTHRIYIYFQRVTEVGKDLSDP